MGDQRQFYGALVRLYPRQFRREYGEDLVQHFGDLVTDRGTRAAWILTALDLTITIPRYHLEQIMNDQRSNIALNLLVVALAVGGVASFLVDVAWLSPVLLVAAAAIAATQKSALAHALRVPDTDRRRRRLRTSACLGATFVVSYIVFTLTVGDSWTITDTLLTVVGTLAMVGAVGYLIAGLATPRTPERGQLAGSA